jgi:hypothetical protein
LELFFSTQKKKKKKSSNLELLCFISFLKTIPNRKRKWGCNDDTRNWRKDNGNIYSLNNIKGEKRGMVNTKLSF